MQAHLTCHPERRAQPVAEGSARVSGQISPLPPVGRNDNQADGVTAGRNDNQQSVVRRRSQTASRNDKWPRLPEWRRNGCGTSPKNRRRRSRKQPFRATGRRSFPEHRTTCPTVASRTGGGMADGMTNGDRLSGPSEGRPAVAADKIPWRSTSPKGCSRQLLRRPSSGAQTESVPFLRRTRPQPQEGRGRP